ncbi:S-layer homology domain-containing protein [Planococcus sp. FY231025]|uniref:S-layer homology domain-containing protein n=1 Tax=Planococcus sp. FY231025 TaxID=3455699 RepID=UPI003F93B298
MKLLPALSGAVLAMSLLASPASAAADLPKTHGFYEEVTYLMDKGVVSGYPDGSVQPDKIVTRAEAAIMIGKLKGFDGAQRASGFSDVTKGMKASGYIAAAKEAGFISGYGDGTFDPYAPITRGDMAIILSRVFVAPFFGASEYSDVSTNMRAHDAIYQVSGASIATGYANGTFKPLAATTRGQFSAFLARGLEPKFQNDTHMAGSYLRDKTKAYSYGDGKEVYGVDIYTNDAEMHGEPLGFVWSYNHEDGEEDYSMEFESRTEFYTAYPASEAYLDLVYPVKVGTKFNIDSPFSPPSVVSGVNVTVETPFKTFTNAVEVHVPKHKDFPVSGYKYYMVPGFGHVKSVMDDGSDLYILMDVQ